MSRRGEMEYRRFNLDPNFKPDKGIYESRLRQFIDATGEYSLLNLPKLYDKERVGIVKNFVEVQYYQIPYAKETSPVDPEKRPPWEEVINKDKNGEIQWTDVFVGQPFGPSWSTTWFKVDLFIPEEWVDSNEQLLFDWDCSNEGIVIDPETLLPYTAFSGNGERTEYLLPLGETNISFYIECGNNGMFGVGAGTAISPPDDNRFFQLRKADLVWPNWEARALYIDFWMLSDAARELQDSSWQKGRARQLANDVMNMFDPDDVSSVDRCRAYLKKHFYDSYTDDAAVYKQGNDNVVANVWAMGNCHIDTAWLWPFAETKRKIVRSWTSQCTIMNEYPEYQFVGSQAQQFKWLLEEHPRFFKEVLIPKVQQAQFFPIGGSWVENDTNIPNGESLCRQFLYGQRFFLKHFGFKSDIFWLPDTFGYSSQVPQICRISGIKRFLTQKLSWNNINSFPHSTFNWVGIDGTEVLTHMPPGNTYTASSHFGDVLRTAYQNKSSEVYPSGLMLYGYGDGGGGPTREMLDKMRRIRSMSNRNGNVIPKLEVGKTVKEFYDDILKKTNNGRTLPSWFGELYFEFHRGTYTTQAEVKRLMRLSEVKIHDLEWIATKTSILFPNEYQYPAKQIGELWENILLCQFHDVLPGTCIEMVYKYEAVPMLKTVVDTIEHLIADALEVLRGTHNNFEKIGTLQWDSKPPLVTTFFEPKVERTLYHASVLDDGKDITLSNRKLEVVISKKTGAITRLYDLIYQIEYLDLENGRNNLGANQFVIFDDKPLNWQAWDTELYSVNQYKYLSKVENVRIKDNSESICSVEIVIAISPTSKIVTTVYLRAVKEDLLDEAKVDITTKVHNWEETNKFLKVEFPVSVLNDFASYETQFGITKRPTHYNTSWDLAKFEVCQHKFADYSDFTKGVSILNDSKYGFSTHGNLMRLSLLRSSKAPDAHADMGNHKFKYAIYPHKGGLSSRSVKLGIQFNYRYKYSIPKDIAHQFKDFITIVGDPNVILSNIKRGEDDRLLNSDYALTETDTTFIVRVYEACGGESKATLLSNLYVKGVEQIDNLELETIRQMILTPPIESVYGRTGVQVHLRPFEVATYRFIV
ncbi:HDL242Cp [Eremothecium sinecaudum]|uniref:Alpha-mannosidase n=1 Tax=Eremothecium sinecaudum TaxID=45286 RepID=A0A0X8HS71_9SACH|nr:HDL242Cp [Eremothecium sinecaudum]AMD20502.1 HDL242Cp [Eremothecium sinecaudum]